MKITAVAILVLGIAASATLAGKLAHDDRDHRKGRIATYIHTAALHGRHFTAIIPISIIPDVMLGDVRVRRQMRECLLKPT